MTDLKHLKNRPVIIGAGLAGLTAALSLAPTPVIVLSASHLGEECSSSWAQGGIAAAVGSDDTPELHAEDTLKAGAGLCDPAIVKLVTEGGAKAIQNLFSIGVPFDRNQEGVLQLGLEGAHSRRRVVHVGGDGAGYAIMRAVMREVRSTPSIEIIENAFAENIQLHDGQVSGLDITRKGRRETIATNRIILATGGAGALWQHTTNPLGSWGCGIALAAKAGALLADLEFMQFHPTAIAVGRDPMPLASEALRGEGATLIDEKGEAVMAGFARKDLEPRDIVAHTIWQHLKKGHQVYLDARKALGSEFAKRFPAIYATCLEAAIDPAVTPIPVRPAAHYHMGGVKVDASGRTSVDGLWAVGEVASTGLHGANRLASNSLLEAAFFGQAIASDVNNYTKNVSLIEQPYLPTASTVSKAYIRTIMAAHVGVVRDKEGLEHAVSQLMPLASNSDQALVALLIATSALRRQESRGSHTRVDCKGTSSQAKRSFITLDDVMPLPMPAPRRALVGA